MLVLTRREGESLMIGDDIRIVVLAAKNGRIRLGIEASKSVEVHRREVWETIQRELKASGVETHDIGGSE